jgi:hypothetical protein
MKATARPFTRLVPAAACAALLALGLATSGCKEEKKLTPPPPVSDYLAPSSAANVLANLKTAYEKKNLAEYRKLFTEDYVFVFNPQDPIDPDHPPPPSGQWGLAGELTSTGNMLTDTHVDQIKFTDWVARAAERADSLLFGPRVWKVRVDHVGLMIPTQTESGDRLTLVLEGKTEVFYFREEPTRLASDGKPSWSIIRWEDWVIGGDKTERASWGLIKLVFS